MSLEEAEDRPGVWLFKFCFKDSRLLISKLNIKPALRLLGSGSVSGRFGANRWGWLMKMIGRIEGSFMPVSSFCMQIRIRISIGRLIDTELNTESKISELIYLPGQGD